MTKEQKQHLKAVIWGKTAQAENRKKRPGPRLLMGMAEDVAREGRQRPGKKKIILNVRLPCFHFILL